MFRRTKIVATLGPATDEPGILEKLILAGVNVVRMNFSHGSPEDHQQRAEAVREYSKKHGKHVAILGDLQGPKIRVAAVAIGVDYLAVSFPRSADDMNQARQLVKDAGGDIYMVAKIERAEAVENTQVLDAIIMASDAVMVARGDLGVEIGDAQLIGVQKHIIERARALNRSVITATQMMETMISSQLPTRAEVFDVANAVLDGTDAVMLSAETAAGQFPVQTVEAMVRVILGAEKHPQSVSKPQREEDHYQAIDESVAMAAMYTANQMKGVKGIAALSDSGSTPLLMSRFGARMPIFAFSKHTKTLRRAALFRGVQTVDFDHTDIPTGEINRKVMDHLQAMNTTMRCLCRRCLGFCFGSHDGGSSRYRVRCRRSSLLQAI